MSIVLRAIMYSNVLIFVIMSFITNGCCDSATEATAVALETSGQLFAPISLVQKIEDDLKAIRTAYPQVKDVVHSPPWVVGELIAQVTDVQLGRINPEYGQVTSSELFDEYKVLKFTAQYNPVVLAKELIEKNLVNSADPNNIVGGGDSIGYDMKTGVYEFSHGWGDCPSGCIYHHNWKFSVSASGPTLISESAPPVGAEEI